MRFALCAMRYSFFLTFSLKLIKLRLRLGDRPVAGRRVLVPLTEVRILVPQPFFYLDGVNTIDWIIFIHHFPLTTLNPITNSGFAMLYALCPS